MISGLLVPSAASPNTAATVIRRPRVQARRPFGPATVIRAKGIRSSVHLRSPLAGGGAETGLRKPSSMAALWPGPEPHQPNIRRKEATRDSAIA